MASSFDEELASLAGLGRESRESISTEFQNLYDEDHPRFRTLFEEFDRNRPTPVYARSARRRLVRSRSPARSGAPHPKKPTIDLRALEHVSEYDTNLMCPICHVPFVDPIVLDCDHTFCAICYEEFRNTPNNEGRTQCPTCRAPCLQSPKKASRLIRNMCNDIRVLCPNQGCQRHMVRGLVERHVLQECSETLLDCPRNDCIEKTKRKHYIPEQCIHNNHVECECGKSIELGRGEWLRHRDEECPITGSVCSTCGSRSSAKDGGLDDTSVHICNQMVDHKSSGCPGAAYGCNERVEASNLDAHSQICIFARIGPTFAKQSALLLTLSEQLSLARSRNEVLETNLERLTELVQNQILPHLHPTHTSADSDVDVDEEIHRPHIPSHRDLLLPAHLRSLSPSPSPEVSSQQHLLALHEQLRSTVADLDGHVASLHQGMTDLEGRTSMQLLNETLRIKEELAHTNAALFSTRAQVAWLLNRERAGQITRGREMAATASIANPQQVQQQAQGQVQQPSASSPQRVQLPAGSPGQGTTASGSASVSPFMLPSRPGLRRLSGSQERVKL